MSTSLQQGTSPNTDPDPVPEDLAREGELFLFKYDVARPQGGDSVSHSTLVVKFCTNFFVIIEGLPDQDDVLRGNYEETCHSPPGTPNKLDQFFFYTSTVAGVLPIKTSPHATKVVFPALLTVNLSPRTLLEIARENTENGKRFCAGANDGQSWAEKAVRAMEPFKVESKPSSYSCTVS